MTWFYISFASKAGHLGSTVVEAKNERDAVIVASGHGINPGGEAMIMPVKKGRETIPEIEALKYRLLTKEELEAIGPITKGRPTRAAYACELCNTGVPHKH